MLHWIYIAMVCWITALVLQELFQEKSWRNQIALSLVLIPLLLRIFHIK